MPTTFARQTSRRDNPNGGRHDETVKITDSRWSREQRARPLLASRANNKRPKRRGDLFPPQLISVISIN